MRSEEEIRQELESTQQDIKKNLITMHQQFQDGFDLSAHNHVEYHSRLQGFVAALLWVLQEKR